MTIPVAAHNHEGDTFLLPFDPNLKLSTSKLALFLDFDGTLVDIAATPQTIRVPPDLPPLISRLFSSLGSSVCIVSGRKMRDIHRYIDDESIDVVAEHGAVSCFETRRQRGWPLSWTELLLTVETCIPKLVVERKKTSVALHYRQQPELEPEVLKFAELLLKHSPSEYMVVNSNMTTEIRRVGIDKGKAINAVMKTPRYLGKRPVFIADDVTDIPGFEAVRKLGGLALHVGTDFAGRTSNVRRWLSQLADQQCLASS
jgi:trehalose 6-phosphate phosphatase